MPKSVFSGAHEHLVSVLKEARQQSGIKQADLAARLGKDQSFVSLIEGSQRRVDVLEFCAISRALGRDPIELFSEVVRRLPGTYEI